MTEKHLKRLNNTLRDTCGRSQNGSGDEGVYKWIQSRHLTYPMRVNSATRAGEIWLPGYTYEWVPQLEEYGLDRWILAMWKAPPSREEWHEMFGREMPWPQTGMYYATDVILTEGTEPTEWLTHDVIAKIKEQRSQIRSFRDALNQIEAGRAYREKERSRVSGDMIDDCVTAFGNIPGARGGGVSFGGVSPEDFHSTSENSEKPN